MKNISWSIRFAFISLLMNAACTGDGNESKNIKISLLPGKWKVVEDIGGIEGPYLIPDGYEYTFSSDGSFLSNENVLFSDTYPGGKYSVSADSIMTLRFQKPGLSDFVKKKKITHIDDQELLTSDDLTPDGTGCIEGCGERFERLD